MEMRSEQAQLPLNILSPEILHDLRTPLNHIIGYSEILRDQAEEDGQNSYITDLQKINNAGKQLLNLLNQTAVQQSKEIHVENYLSTNSTDENDLSQSKILIVDDNSMNCEVLSRRLERLGYEVGIANNGITALSSARSSSYDLVLLDIMMPEMDGYETLQHFKADEKLRNIPIIMISAIDELESVIRCIELGAEDYMSKPFEPTLLKARIGACLEKKLAQDRERELFDSCQQSFCKLQELEKFRDDLMNMVVHDLRTPLTSIISGMQTLDAISELNEAQREMLGISLSGGERLMEMINELLDVAKLENGEMQLDYSLITVNEIVNPAIQQVSSLVSENGLTLQQQIQSDIPAFQADKDKLIRTLVNLLGNAIKFTPPGGKITINSYLTEDEKSLIISVTDTGEGIPSEAFDRIFEKFGQVELRQRGRKLSTGLGLTFCKLAVEAHNGCISVDSKEEVGSTFSFTVPLTLLEVNKSIHKS